MKQFQLIITTILFMAGLTNYSHAKSEWIDITEERLVNSGFDGNSNNGWTFVSNAGSQAVRCESMEFWNGTFDIYQTVSSLPAGHYRMSVQSYYRCQDNNNGFPNYTAETENITAYMYAGNTKQKLKSIYSFYFTENPMDGTWATWVNGQMVFFPNTMETATKAFSEGAYQNSMEFDHNGGDLRLGLINEVFTQNNWCIFDNFKLEIYDEVVDIEKIELNVLNKEMIVGETTKLNATVLPTNATYNKLIWESSNNDVATVDANGNVSARGEGTAIIYVKSKKNTNIKASCTISVKDNQAKAGELVINEIMASNVDEFVSPAFQFDGWIELYNPTDNAVGLNNLWFSDDATNKKKWRAPIDMGTIAAKGYKVVWMDSNKLCHTNVNLKLKVDGGQLFISDNNGNIVCEASYPESMERISYARTTDGGEDWANTDTPTPGKANTTATFGTAQLEAPIVKEGSTIFKSSMTVNVEIPTGCTLRYTTDGTLPTMENGRTNNLGRFTVKATTNYRFRLYKKGMMASRVTSRSYIKWDKDYKLPVLAVVTDPKFLYDDSLGVYVQGVNGIPGNGKKEPCNWNMDWERPVNMSYINEQGDMVFNQDVNLEMCGGWSRALTPHSFKLKGEKEFGGNKNLNYPFFSAKPYIRNRTLQVRNGGNDNSCRIKDAALATIMQTAGFDIDLQSYQPVHEFINGKYIGVLNVREPNNKHYAYANYGYDNEMIEQFEMNPDSGYVQKEGTGECYQRLYNLSTDAAKASTYEEIKQMLDIDEYTNYMAALMYTGGTDWPQNNIKGFTLKEGGKFRFVSFDLDFAFNTNDPFNTFEWKQNYTFDELYNGLPRVQQEIKFVTIFLNMLNNQDFRKKFIDTYCLMGGSVFEPQRCNEIIDSLVTKVQPEMAFMGESPNNSANSMKGSLNDRLATMINALKSYWRMKLTEATPVDGILASDTKGARIEINGIDVPTGKFNGKLFAPVTIKAVAPAGYKFAGWRSATETGSTILAQYSNWKYYDKGSLDKTNWTTSQYNDNNWQQGKAPLGYGKDGLNTTISYGNNSRNKYPTYYFRQTINLTKAPKADSKVYMNIVVDDGCIIYVNGKEAYRYNMPQGNVNFNTVSSTYAPGNPDHATISFDASLLKKGSNLIAVEVHNNSITSSDIYWDAQMVATIGEGNDNSNYKYVEPSIEMPSSSFNLVACYEKTDKQIEEGYTPVRVNEISAANDIYVNEYGKKADWVELYNTTDEDINVEGMYLSNDANNLKLSTLDKGESNANTIIPAKGYMVVWCDKQPSSIDLHTSFKLSAGGGVVALTSADESWTDSICYPAHDGYQSIGRYADGAQSVYLFHTPTIGKANRMSEYTQKIAEQTSGVTNLVALNTNNITIRMAAGALVVRTKAREARIEIFTLSGQKVTEANMSINNGYGMLSASQLYHGCFIAKATDSNGKVATCKFTK